MEQVHLITSTGRTGTQFFEYFINTNTVNAVCRHEPKPSRRFKVYSNLYLDGKLTKQFVIRQYLRARSRMWRHLSCPRYVESNNFLFGCIPAMAETFSDFKVVHVVRAPEAYILSHLNHRFWKGRKKLAAIFLPYWIEPLGLTMPDKCNPVRILAARWVVVNQTIARYAASGNYMLVKFEDLFSRDLSTAVETISTIAEFLNLRIKDSSGTRSLLRHKKNVSAKIYRRRDITPEDNLFIQDRCGTLKKQYGYT